MERRHCRQGLFSLALFVLFCCPYSSGTPILVEYEPPSLLELSFMMKYGYLPGAGDDSDELKYAEGTYTGQSIAGAVRTLQQFAGLPQTGVLDAETKKLFHKRRCGIRDIEGSETRGSRRKRYVAKKGWNKNLLTYRVVNATKTLSKGRIEELMQKAFDVWAPHGQLQFVKKDHSNVDIEIIFTSGDHGDGNSFDGPGNIVAHAFAPPHGGMHFDDDEIWGENDFGDDEDVTDLFAVAVHEAGHALGLGHSSVKSSIMYPYYQLPVGSLSADDITGMHELYMRSAESSPALQVEWTESEAPKATVATAADEQPPEICSTRYDTVAIMKYQIFVFKEQWMWIFRDQKLLDEVYPIKYDVFFKGLPSNVTIEATYERSDGNLVIFSGRTYWLIDSKYRYVRSGSLSDYQLPAEVTKLQAVFRSNYNNKTYFFESDRFYRFDESSWTLDYGYPKPMSAWRNIPAGINSVAVWKEETYFFKGPRFWRFDNRIISAHENYPLPTAQIWFGCPEESAMSQYFTYP